MFRGCFTVHYGAAPDSSITVKRPRGRLPRLHPPPPEVLTDLQGLCEPRETDEERCERQESGTERKSESHHLVWKWIAGRRRVFASNLCSANLWKEVRLSFASDGLSPLMWGDDKRASWIDYTLCLPPLAFTDFTVLELACLNSRTSPRCDHSGLNVNTVTNVSDRYGRKTENKNAHK